MSRISLERSASGIVAAAIDFVIALGVVVYSSNALSTATDPASSKRSSSVALVVDVTACRCGRCRKQKKNGCDGFTDRSHCCFV